MDAEIERRAYELYLRVADLPETAGHAVLEVEERTDSEAVARVRELMAERTEENGFPDDVGDLAGVSALMRSALAGAESALGQPGTPPGLDEALIGDRFDVVTTIGAGRFGAVYRATDRLTGADVAVKLLFGPEHIREISAPRERIALLALDVPGVVRLIDSGTYEGRPYIVTEYLDGLPFPGREVPVEWSELEGLAVTLLEILGRTHAAGVVHGDLKPANILVDGAQVRVLDFGVAVGEAIAHAGSPIEAWGGTLPYLAPELCRDEADLPTVATDLYAVGILLFEALTGRVPHEASDRQKLLENRAAEPVDMSPLRTLPLPGRARRILAALLDAEPSGRPPSAADALEALRGGSLLLEDVRDLVERALPERRAASAEDLWPLFSGPNRLFHLREDAADLLWRRTAGDPIAVVETASRWVRDGNARIEDGLLHVARDQLVRLDSISHDEGPAFGSASDLPGPEAEAILDLVVAARHHATVETISSASGNSLEVTQRHLDQLSDRGLVQPRRDDVYSALVTSQGWSSPSRRIATHAKLAQCLRPGTPGRLAHIVEAGLLDEAAAEVVAGTQALCQRGDVASGRELATRGLLIARTASRPDDEEAAIVRELLEAAICEGTEAALRAAVYEAERSRSARVSLGGLDHLARAALRCVRGDGAGALALANSVRIAMDDSLLELRRQSVRVFAANFLENGAAAAVVESACRWAESSGHHRARLEALTWRAEAAGRAGDFALALRLHHERLSHSNSHQARIGALLGSSAAAMELHDLATACDDALQARDRARASRHTAFEAMAEARLRSSQYRADDDLRVDTELVDAVRHLPHSPPRGAIVLTEAAIAWRREETAAAVALADEAARTWERLGVRDVALLARALACAVSDRDGPLVLPDAEELLSFPRPGITAQVLGLHALRAGGLPSELRALLADVAARFDVDLHSARREILSLDECLRFAGG